MVPNAWTKYRIPRVAYRKSAYWDRKWVKSNPLRRKKERKRRKKKVSYACNRHHGWRMQAAWTKNTVDNTTALTL